MIDALRFMFLAGTDNESMRKVVSFLEFHNPHARADATIQLVDSYIIDVADNNSGSVQVNKYELQRRECPIDAHQVIPLAFYYHAASNILFLNIKGN